MFCRHCGFELADGDAFCAKCGTKVIAVDETTDISNNKENYSSIGGVPYSDDNTVTDQIIMSNTKKENDATFSKEMFSFNTIKPVLILIGIIVVLTAAILGAKKASDASRERLREEYSDKAIEKPSAIDKTSEEASINSIKSVKTPNPTVATNPAIPSPKEYDKSGEGDYLCYWSSYNVMDESKWIRQRREIMKKYPDLPALPSQMVINEIYAKHGYIFPNQELNDFFTERDWYQGTTDDMNNISKVLNDAEKRNISYLKELGLFKPTLK